MLTRRSVLVCVGASALGSLSNHRKAHALLPLLRLLLTLGRGSLVRRGMVSGARTSAGRVASTSSMARNGIRNGRQGTVAMLAAEIGVDMVFSQAMAATRGQVAALPRETYEAMERHNAEALWVRDDENSLDIEVSNFTDDLINDRVFLSIENAENGTILLEQGYFVSVAPNTVEYIPYPFAKNGLPLGPVRFTGFFESTYLASAVPSVETVVVVEYIDRIVFEY